MSHEKSKEQAKVKKQATKTLKEKRAAKKAKKAEKGKQCFPVKNKEAEIPASLLQ